MKRPNWLAVDMSFLVHEHNRPFVTDWSVDEVVIEGGRTRRREVWVVLVLVCRHHLLANNLKCS
jgi:2-C-methyl-D-erythritol 4-phosphate cytidylyltransferase